MKRARAYLNNVRRHQPAPPSLQSCPEPVEPPITSHRGSERKRRLMISAPVVVLMIGAGLFGWHWHKQKAATSPFNAAIMASVGVPLYYPTILPDGFHIDKRSINEPQSGTVVLTMNGPRGEKLYMSEEARPAAFNLGGFYNSFIGLKEIAVSGGAIAVGYINGGRTIIGSRSINKTWILANSNAHVSPATLVRILESLKLSY